MKKGIILLMIIMILLGGISCSKRNYNEVIVYNNEPEFVEYKVERITEQGTVYIIELSKNDSIYHVLTKSKPPLIQVPSARNDITKCNTKEIRIGRAYYLQLTPLFEDKLSENYVGTFEIQHYVEFNSTQIIIYTGETLYTTKNLNGLCLIK